MLNQKCIICNKEFILKFSYQKTCSKQCGFILGTNKRKKIFTFICKTCGNNFQRNRNRNKNYCSHNCYIKYINNRKNNWKQNKVCLICSINYQPTYKKQKYCSRKCFLGILHKEKSEKHSVNMFCDWCKIEFTKTLSQIGKNNNFCSKKCSHLYSRKGNSKFIEKECKNCKQKFILLYIDKEQEFCSRSCSKSGEFSHFFGKEGPMKGKHPWTYGLTKETDERIVNLGKKISVIHKKQFEEGIRSNKGELNPNYGKTIKDRTIEQLQNYSNAAALRSLNGQSNGSNRFKNG